MKNFIRYYYDLDIDCIIKDDRKYTIESGKEKYIFKRCSSFNAINLYQRIIEEKENLNSFFEMIPNKFGSFVSYVNNIPYVLSKVSILHDKIIRIKDINSQLYLSEFLVSEKDLLSWKDLWANKIDTLENWLYAKRERYSKYAHIFNYYIGLSENALQYLKDVELVNDSIDDNRLTIQHYRLNSNSSLYDYFDFTNVIVDNRSRDISEYIKSCFLCNKCDYSSIFNYLNNNSFSKYELQILYARLLFPTFFYDYIEGLFESGKDIDIELSDSFADKYERNLIEFSKLFSDKYKIIVPKWVIKKT